MTIFYGPPLHARVDEEDHQYYNLLFFQANISDGDFLDRITFPHAEIR